MKYKNRKCALLASGIVLLSSATANAITSNWTGTAAGTGSWSSVSPTVPGWDTGTAPNGVGDVAQLTAALSGSPETIQDTGAAVTVGAINYGVGNALNNFSWTITNTNGITLNQDGAGSGFATITNSNATAGNANALVISAGTITLADNLSIIKTGAVSSNSSGAIQIASDITGNGNLTFNSNQVIPVLTNPTGSIRLTGNNSFVGNVLVENGLVVFTNASAFGDVSNVITMGISGSSIPGPEVTPYIISQTAVTVPNNIVVVPNNPTAVIGTTYSATATAGSYTGLISVGTGSILYLHSNSGSNSGSVATDVGLTISNVISGDGGITKTGGSTTGGVVTLSDLNTFTGKTIISRGVLRVSSLNNFNGGTPTSASSGLGRPTTLANATIGMSGGNNNVGILGYVGSGETSDRPIELLGNAGASGGGGVDSSGASGPLILTGGVTYASTGTRTFTLRGINTGNNTISGNIANSSGTMNLAKSGTGKWVLSGTNSQNGVTTISNGILQYQSPAAIAGSTRNVTVTTAGVTPNITTGVVAAGYAIDQAFLDRIAFASVGTIALAANSGNNLNMTGFTAASLGAVGNVSFTGSLTPDGTVYRLGGDGGGTLTTNTLLSGGNSLVISNNGVTASTVALTGNNTYSGTTAVNQGTLLVNGTHSAAGDYTIASGAILGGGGSIGSNVILQSGSNIAPGNSPGVLTINGNLDASAGGTYGWQLGALSASGAGTNFDQIVVGGNTALGGTSTLNLDFTVLTLASRPGHGNTFWNAGHTWKVLDSTGTNTGSTNFTSLLGAAGPGSWTTTVGTSGDAGDILLRYVAGDIASASGVGIPDAFVGGDDLNVILAHWGQSVTTGDLTLGDLTGPAGTPDGFVGGDDLNIILANWGKGAAAVGTGLGGGAAINAVPEPSTFVLAGLGLVGLGLIRKRRAK